MLAGHLGLGFLGCCPGAGKLWVAEGGEGRGVAQSKPVKRVRVCVCVFFIFPFFIWTVFT